MAEKNSAKSTPPATTAGVKRFLPGSTTLYYLLAITVLWVIFYFPLLFGLNFLWEDFREQAYPNLVFAVDCLKQGSFPFWTPYEFGGMPFSSDPQTTLFYPPHWLLLGLSMLGDAGGILFTWYVLLHVLILGIGAFFLARDCDLHPTAAFFVATAMMFTGFVSLHVIHTIFLYTVAWFPVVFLLLRKAFRTGRIDLLATGALVFGMSFLGGYPQYSMYFLYFFFLWTAYEVLVIWKRTRRISIGIPLFFAVFAGIAVAMACIQYLPSFEHMALSLREKMTFEESCQGSISPSRLLTFVAPRFFGFVTGDAAGGSPYWGFPNQMHFFWETNAFAGVATLLLAGLAFVTVRDRRRGEVIFFAALCAAALVLCLGSNTPLYGLAYNLVPGFKSFRIPGRFTLWISFCLILLAGYGLDGLIKRTGVETKRCLMVLGVMAGLIALSAIAFIGGMFDTAVEYFTNAEVLKTSKTAMLWTLVSVLASSAILFYLVKNGRPWLAGGLGLVVFVELLAFGQRFGCGNINPSVYYRRFDLSPLKRELRDHYFRVQSRLYQGQSRGEMLLPRNIGNVAAVPLTEGYNQLMLRRYNDFLYKVNEEVGRRLLGIQYKKVLGQPRLERLAGACPRVALVPRFRVFDNQDSLIAFINSPQFVACSTLALESAPDPVPAPGGPGSVRMVAERPDRIEMEVTASGASLLSVSDVYYPAWKVYIDGKRSRIIPANLLFRAVAVPAGTHRVVMVFRPEPLRLGALSALSALVLGLLLAAGGRLARLRRPFLGLGGAS